MVIVNAEITEIRRDRREDSNSCKNHFSGLLPGQARTGLPVATIGTRFGSVPNHLPLPHIPVMSLSLVEQMFSPAVTIGFLAALESLLAAVDADGMLGTRHRSNMEQVAQGFGNIGSILFGGIPATGAIARTPTNVMSGGRTPIAGMIHAVFKYIQ